MRIIEFTYGIVCRKDRAMRGSALRHLLSVLPPGLAAVFVITAPHPWWWALAMLPLPLALVLADWASGSAREREEGPPAAEAGRFFDVLLVVHAALHFAVLAAFLRLAAREGMASADAIADTLVGAVLVGHNTGWSAIIVGHELIHRQNRGLRLLGRALLCTALYDHFATEHVRGHHVRVATGADPATARFGETLWAFKRRTIPGQLRSAWRIECRRLGDEGMPWWDRRLLGSSVVHGLAVEVASLVALGAFLGPAAVVAFLVQAWQGVDLLETVNYFEHWGLSREGRRVGVTDSWDTDSAFTRYALIGLARHADHHTHPARPYQSLERVSESPKLPYGYPPMVLLASIWNSRFRALMTEELRRRALGPFA
jgi:alkane 1-monooxygenase